MTRTVTEDRPSQRDPVGHGKDFGFYSERNRKQSLESLEQRHDWTQRPLKGPLWLAPVWRKGHLGARRGAGRPVRQQLGWPRQGVLADPVRRGAAGRGTGHTEGRACQALLMSDRKSGG